jgi:hypothetical protein
MAKSICGLPLAKKDKMSKKLESQIEEINSVQILGDRDYDWVWEYAQFRFTQSILDMNKTEEKAGNLLKFVVNAFVAFWALLMYFTKGSTLPLGSAFNLRIVAGLSCLCVSAALGIYCLLPVRKLLPFGEEVAIRFVNDNAESSRRPRGRFGLGLKLCSDTQELATTTKSWCVLIGFIFLVVSVGLLFAGLYSRLLLSHS